MYSNNRSESWCYYYALVKIYSDEDEEALTYIRYNNNAN
jgi:hypothetical protein